MIAVRTWRPNRVDVALVAAASSFGIGDSLTLDANNLLGPHRVAAAVVTGLGGLLLLWRRYYPTAVAVACMVVHVVAYAPVHVLLSAYAAGAHERHRRWVIVVAVFLVGMQIVTIPWQVDESPVRALVWAPFYLAALVIGVQARHHDVTVAKHAEFLVREREQLVGWARAEERALMAREMHDVVAHRITLIVVEAGALEVSAGGSPDEIAAAAGHIRVTGRTALEELRQILAALTFADGDTPLTPQPGINDIATLVRDARDAGLDIAFLPECTPEELPTVLGHTAYRVVQEALTNVLRHGGGAPIRVTTRCSDGALLLSVVNSPPRWTPAHPSLPGAGRGLIGLHERVSLLGGTIYAGLRDDGGFEVTATLPIGKKAEVKEISSDD